MCRTVVLDLTPRQQTALVRVRDYDPKPHRREKAAAILKVADGWQVREVAAVGLLRRRNPKTVSAWVARYKARGLGGLTVRAGRGRKPAFSPLRPRAGEGAGDRRAAAEPPRARAAPRPVDAAAAGRGGALADAPE